MIQFDCPHCGKGIRLKEEFAGRKGSCPHCKNPIQAPAVSRPAAAPPSVRPTRPAPKPRPAAVPEPTFLEDEEAPSQPAVVRREKQSSKKKINPIPLVIGGGCVAGVALICLVVWLVMKPGGQSSKQLSTSTPAAPSGSPVPPAPALDSAPKAAQPSGGDAPTATPGATAASSPAPAGAARADLFAYLPAGLDAMAGARVAEALQAEDKARVKSQLDSVLQPVMTNSGLKLDAIEEIVMGVGSQADQLLIAVRAKQPLDSAVVRKSLGCNEGPQRINQFDIYSLPSEPGSAESAATFMDARTFLIGAKSLIQQSLESASGAAAPGVLKDVTSVTGAKTHLWVVAKMNILKSQIAQLANLGVAETIFASSLDKVGMVAMSYDLTTGMQLRMSIECNSDGEAKLVRGVADSIRVALKEAEKKQTFDPSGGGSGSSSGGGAPPSGSGGMSGGRGSGGMSGGGSGRGMSGPGGGGMYGPGSGGMSGPGSGMPGGMPGGSQPGSVWDATEVKQSGSHVLVTLPPVKVAAESLSSPLDLFGSATQAGFARSAVGSRLFPGSLRRSSEALRALERQDGTIPSGTVMVDKLPRPFSRLSWLTSLLPYLGYQELHDQISFTDEWTDKKNIPVAATIVDAFLDPMVPLRRWKGPPMEGVALTHYVGMGGVGVEAPRLPKEHPKAGIFGYDRKTALSDVRDGVSNTIMMIQVRDVFGPWIQGGGATVRPAQLQPYIGATGGFGSPGDAGVMTIFADGSVRVITKDIDPKVFEALCSINGGEKVDLAALVTEPPKNPPLPTTPAAAANAPTPPATAPSSTDSESGLTRYDLKDHGFSVSLPRHWKAIDMNKLDDELKAFEQQNPQVAAVVGPAFRTVKQIGGKFCGMDIQTPSTFATNINVVREERPTPINFDEYVTQNLMLLETIPVAIKPINHQRVKLSSGDAERVEYGLNLTTPAGQIKVSVVQFLMVKNNIGFVLTFSTLPERLTEQQQLIEKIGNSFRFLN